MPDQPDTSNQEPFDERAFLEGRMAVVSGEAKPRPLRGSVGLSVL